jgi:hypothetical protein
MSNTAIPNSTIADNYDEEIVTYEETILDEQYDCTPRFKKLKVCQQERKQQIKERQIEKCTERISREPGTRLSKTAKKIAGRRAFINNWFEFTSIHPEGSDNADLSDTDKTEQKTFGRIKRKPGHRQREWAFYDN